MNNSENTCCEKCLFGSAINEPWCGDTSCTCHTPKPEPQEWKDPLWYLIDCWRQYTTPELLDKHITAINDFIEHLLTQEHEKAFDYREQFEAGRAAALAEAEKKIEELISALISMYSQYCSDGHHFMSAGEEASSILEQYNYASFDEIGQMSLKSLQKEK